jgi:xanthosine utilization system XapX-like protein
MLTAMLIGLGLGLVVAYVYLTSVRLPMRPKISILSLSTAITLTVVFLIGGCTTPNKWAPSSHAEIMRQCSLMCGKARVKSYAPLTGECECTVKGKRIR